MTAREVVCDSGIRELLEKLTARLDALNSSVAVLARRVEHIEILHAPDKAS